MEISSGMWLQKGSVVTCSRRVVELRINDWYYFGQTDLFSGNYKCFEIQISIITQKAEKRDKPINVPRFHQKNGP